MSTVVAYLRLYLACLVKALQSVRGNLWTLLLLPGLYVALTAAALPLAQVPLLGGIALSLLSCAAGSSYLYFVGALVAHGKVSTQEFKTSVGRYFFSLMNFFFVVWVAQLLLGLASPRAATALYAVAAIVLNPVPETIYVRGTHGGTETIAHSFKFLQENWIEWFLPQLLLVFPAGYAVLHLPVWGVLLLVAAGHLLMVFRGHLYVALDGTTHRQRVYRYAAPR